MDWMIIRNFLDIEIEIEDTIVYMIDKVNLNLVQEIINSIIELDITKENIKC